MVRYEAVKVYLSRSTLCAFAQYTKSIKQKRLIVLFIAFGFRTELPFKTIDKGFYFSDRGLKGVSKTDFATKCS